MAKIVARGARIQKQPRGLARLRAESAKRGGVCLSRAYQGYDKPHRFRCANGHIWETRPVSIRHGHWCQICHIDSLRLDLAEIQRIARGRGGACLSKSYINCKNKIKFRCGNGHVFALNASSLRIGNWCRHCSAEASRLTLDEMRELAQARGGECLSKRYVDSMTKLLWRCADGHEWLTTPSCIKYRKSWCPQCKYGRSKKQDRSDRVSRLKTIPPESYPRSAT